MKFGLYVRGKLTGAELCVRILQLASLLPIPYVLIAPGYLGLFMKEGFFSFLFDLGISALPRWEALALSGLYRAAGGELTVFLVLLAFALAYGLAAGRLLRRDGPGGSAVRIVLAVLIALELVFRLLPLHCNQVFGLPAALVGFALRLGGLILVLLDLRAARRSAREAGK